MKNRREFSSDEKRQLIKEINDLSSGSTLELACRKIGISQTTYYRWNKLLAKLGPETPTTWNKSIVTLTTDQPLTTYFTNLSMTENILKMLQDLPVERVTLLFKLLDNVSSIRFKDSGK